MNQPTISAIVLTHNEELNIEKCLSSLRGWVDEIIIVDSHSDDKTIDICREFTDKIFQNTFQTHNIQWKWALENTNLENDWVIGIDSDQYLPEELKSEITNIINTNKEIDGVFINRKYIFRDKWIKHGDMFPKYLLKLFKKDKVLINTDELVDHHFYINGTTVNTKNFMVEENLKENNLQFWIKKHKNYAKKFASEYVNNNKNSIEAKLSGNPDQKVLFLKNTYYKFPILIRPFVYYIYRYFLKLGFLDGSQGFVFHTLHSLWFRLLIDFNIIKLRFFTKKN